jgi:hypothetical protein
MSAGHPVQARFKPNELNDLDEWRRSQPNPLTRGGALKKLVRIALHGAKLQPGTSAVAHQHRTQSA